MKKLFAAFVLALVSFVNVQAGTVDLRQPVPKTLDLVVGETVTFENKQGSITAKETDGKGGLFEARPHNAFNQTASFKATRVGEGEIDVVFPSQGLATVVKKYTIKVKVSPAPVNHALDYSKKPATMDVSANDKILVEVKFKGDPGLFDPMLTPTVVTTDGQKEAVLESVASPVTRKDADTIVAWQIKAARKGTAEIRFVDPAGKVKATVKVTVK